MRVLFVCTGNTCRSPMAEALARLARPGWETRSRGVSVYSPRPAADKARAVIAERGGSLDGHISAQIEREDLEWADAAYCVTSEHAWLLRRRFPEFDAKIGVLPGSDIGDPYGMDTAAYRACADALDAAIGLL